MPDQRDFRRLLTVHVYCKTINHELKANIYLSHTRGCFKPKLRIHNNEISYSALLCSRISIVVLKRLSMWSLKNLNPYKFRYLSKFKGYEQCQEIFDCSFLALIIFPQAPEYRYRWQICRRFQQHRWSTPLVSLIPVVHLELRISSRNFRKNFNQRYWDNQRPGGR